jgi:hypothetical protein
MSSISSISYGISGLPVAIGAAGLACALYERSCVRGSRGGSRGGARATDELPLVAVLGAAVSLILYPLSLPADADRRALVVAAGLAGALWLAGRADEDTRLQPLFLGAAGAVAGARALLGLTLLPLVVPALVALWRAADPARRGRTLAGAFIVLGAGHAVGLLAVGHHDAPAATAMTPLAWWSGAARAVGPAALALALAGLALGLLGTSRRRGPSAVLAAALALEIASGHAGVITSLALSLGVGVLLIECGERLAARGLRGAELALIPLALLALAEPLSARVRAVKISAPTFGPVPPPRR